MWGSVFYTWRQSEHSNQAEDSTSSTCWPRVSSISFPIGFLISGRKGYFIAKKYVSIGLVKSLSIYYCVA